MGEDVPDDVASAPPVAVARRGEKLKEDPGALVSYGGRVQTIERTLGAYLRPVGHGLLG